MWATVWLILNGKSLTKMLYAAPAMKYDVEIC